MVALKRRSDQAQAKMTQECEQILDEAENIHKDNLALSRSRLNFEDGEKHRSRILEVY